MASNILNNTGNYVRSIGYSFRNRNQADMMTPQSLYAIPAAWILSIAPHFYAAGLGGKRFDNKSPRNYTSSLKDDQTLTANQKARIVRAEGAQQNGFENLGLFAAAVLAGNYARLDNWTLNALSGGYLLSRAAYNLIYINNETDGAAAARTGAFLSGVAMIFTFFIKSGNAVRNSVL